MILACQFALAAILVGLLARGRWRLARTLPVYVAAALAGNALRYYWPERFFVPEFFMAKQAAYDVLKIALALEIGWRAFVPFRGALQSARLLALLFLAGAATVALSVAGSAVASPDPWYLLLLGDLHPRIVLATLWLMLTILGAAQWYLVPLHPFHVGILGSFGAYMAVDAALTGLLGTYGWVVQPYYNELGTVAYLCLLTRWGWLTWGPESERAEDYRAVLSAVHQRFAC